MSVNSNPFSTGHEVATSRPDGPTDASQGSISSSPTKSSSSVSMEGSPGAGLTLLQEQAPRMSFAAKVILKNLLQDHLVTDLTLDSSTALAPPRKRPRKPIDSTMSDERVMQLAQEGELSFLASLLKVIEEEEDDVVTTKLLIKACCLAVEPARVPALCDAKEMVMAALYFLSQPVEISSKGVFPTVPLIQPVHGGSDLEKRSYRKAGDWTMKDPVLLELVLNLEQVFYYTIDYKWLAREHMCPTLPSGRDLLLLKGSPPAFATKTKKPAAPRSRKPKPSPTASQDQLSTTSSFAQLPEPSPTNGSTAVPSAADLP